MGGAGPSRFSSEEKPLPISETEAAALMQPEPV
jgi:hypothetical protein